MIGIGKSLILAIIVILATSTTQINPKVESIISNAASFYFIANVVYAFYMAVIYPHLIHTKVGIEVINEDVAYDDYKTKIINAIFVIILDILVFSFIWGNVLYLRPQSIKFDSCKVCKTEYNIGEKIIVKPFFTSPKEEKEIIGIYYYNDNNELIEITNENKKDILYKDYVYKCSDDDLVLYRYIKGTIIYNNSNIVFNIFNTFYNSYKYGFPHMFNTVIHIFD